MSAELWDFLFLRMGAKDRSQVIGADKKEAVTKCGGFAYVMTEAVLLVDRILL